MKHRTRAEPWNRRRNAKKLRAVKAGDISTTYKPVEMKMSSARSHHEGLGWSSANVAIWRNEVQGRDWRQICHWLKKRLWCSTYYLVKMKIMSLSLLVESNFGCSSALLVAQCLKDTERSVANKGKGSELLFILGGEKQRGLNFFHIRFTIRLGGWNLAVAIWSS